MSPLLILAIGVGIVLVSILWLRLNAFIGLITAAMVVSLLAPGETADKLSRVAAAFGNTAGGIGIAIALAAVIGGCLIASGAADRIVQASLALYGERNGSAALAASGFVLSIPVFFDTVFYLLFPLARSMHRRTGRDYLRYLLAIGAGGAVTHTMVPPTPGPLLMADAMKVDVGMMMMVGALVAIPMTVSGLLYARWIGRRMTILEAGEQDSTAAGVVDSPAGDNAQPNSPSLGVSLLPVLLPVLMIASKPVYVALVPGGPAADWLSLVADKNLALLVAAASALLVYALHRKPNRQQVASLVEESLVTAGIIVLITAAGGAFGGMLKVAGVGDAIAGLFANDPDQAKRVTGMTMLWLSFGMAALLKTSQGSTTVALITASSIVAAMQTGSDLPFHPVYLCTAIGSGAMITSWMNDSGFWLFCKMGGLTETEGLKTWSVIMLVMGLAGMAATVILASVWPMTA